MRLRAGGAVGALLVLAGSGALAACTGQPARPSGTAGASCTPVTGPGFDWPAGIPADLPMPSGARLDEARQLASGFTLVTFSTPGTVRANLLSISTALRRAGYTVGRGIVGASESRLPFTRDGKPGVLRLTAVDACTTRWQVQA